MILDDHHPDCDGSGCELYNCAAINSWDPWDRLAWKWSVIRDRARAALSRGGRS